MQLHHIIPTGLTVEVRSSVGAVIDDQHLLALLTGQYIHESDHQSHQVQQKSLPSIPEILQELVGAILLESQFPVVDNAQEEFAPPNDTEMVAVNTARGFALRSLRMPLPLSSVPTIRSS
jgi:hypothetical protein